MDTQQLTLGDMLAEVPLGADDPWAEWVGMPEFSQQDRRPYFSLIVHFETPGDVERFAHLVEQAIHAGESREAKSIWYPANPPQQRKHMGWVADGP